MAITGNGNAKRTGCQNATATFFRNLPKTLIVQMDWQQQFVIFSILKSDRKSYTGIL
jgi:hypothetical protein